MSKVLTVGQTKVIPVITLHREQDAVPLAQALRDGGLQILEVTLRTPAALAAIHAIAQAVPEVQVGAGTIIEPHQFQAAKDAGAQFCVSPGLTPALALSARATDLPYLPGVTTPSEVIHAQELGYTTLKFFPAELSGGINMLRNFAALYPQVTFCPTGGISADNMTDYLAQPNVMCVGGTWLSPQALIESQDWTGITALAKQVA